MQISAGTRRVINSIAPIRVCDNGGWTDTWFAGSGKVFNIAVSPYVEVQLTVYPDGGDRPRITIHAENYGVRYGIDLPNGNYQAHPLIEAAFDYFGLPADIAVEAAIFSETPGGCSTGTSAAVSVALIGALDYLRPQRMAAHEVALAAQRIETELLHLQCGVQDQIASAYGGINFIDIYAYPRAAVSPLPVSEDMWWELESRLALIYVGQTHNSSAVHETVIRELEGRGPDCPKLVPLREAAEQSKDALMRGDLAALGQAMIRNTEAQAGLNPGLIGPGHRTIIDAARAAGALGWKVNGAGGNGGSVTILTTGDRSARRALIRDILSANPAFQLIPIHLSRHGLRRWESPAV